MKRLFTLLLSIYCYSVFAQSPSSTGHITPAGGCIYDIFVNKVTEGYSPVFTLISNRSYFVNLSVQGAFRACTGDIQVTLSNNAAGITNYLYNVSDGTYDISLSTVAVPPGIYDLAATFYLNSEVAAGYSTKISVIDITAVQQIDNTNSISIFPNPATDLLTINYTDAASPIEAIRMTDMSGRQVKMLQPVTTFGISQISLSDLPSGMYIMQLHSTDDVFYRKVVVNH
ncbi:MAG: C-terminal target protein [Flavipsychrobacter sp.]|nr:C-terminal target protein [Flavipsychrobacter sp.]